MKTRETVATTSGSDSSPKTTILPTKKDYFHVEANIQNEFGVCGWILTILSYLLIFFTLPISACMCIKVVQEYERAVIFRLGRLMPGGAKGPGIFFIVPCIDTYRKVDLRVLSFEVPPQEILSKDSVTVAVDAVVYFRISNATISVTNVEDAARSTKLLAQTTLRNILGTKTLAEMLSDREAISHQMQTTLDEATEPWGVKVERVEVKDVRLPVQLQRAMAAEAEAAREARAKVIVAEGEQKASRALKEAAEVIAESPSALQLRYLQTLNSISAEKNSTIIFPFPIDLLSAFLQRTPPKVEEPPALPKKIRSCCLYKYPDWVQGMVGGEGGGGHGHSHGGGGGLGSSQGAYHPSQAGSGPSTTTTSGRPLLRSMREAQFHSAAPPISAPSQSQTSASQLDPGSRSGQQSRRSSKAPGAGANSLLKQAIANRLMPHATTTDGGESSSSPNMPSSSATSPTTEPAKVHKTDSSEMSKSVLLNPAWYRDEQGRTGFKTSDWEKVSNQQKSVVKESRKKRKESTSGVIKELDSDLLSQSSSEKAESGSDNKSVTSVQSDQKDQKDSKNPKDTKESKSDKKAAKALEKEKKKMEKEQKKLEKAQKKKEAEEEKKLKKMKGSSTNVSEVVEHESAELKTLEKKKEKAEATITLTMVSKDKKSKSKPEGKHDSEKQQEATSTDSSKEGSRKESKDSSKEKVKKQSSKDENADKDSRIEGRPPSGTTHSSVRKLKAESSSKKSGHGEPRKKNIGDRRDSSMSELSRGSFKSVTFNDRVQTHEIERNSSVYTSSEDDAAIMSDDEMSKPSQTKMKKKLTMLQQDPQSYDQVGRPMQQQEQADIYDDDDLDDFEEQERLAFLAAQGYDFRREMQYREGVDYEVDSEEEAENEDEDGEDTLSQNSYYAEDVEGADIYLRNEHSFLGTDMSQRPPPIQNLGPGGYEMFDRTLLGSMSKLHGEDSASNSLLFGYNLPRSASGYFEPPPEGGHMSFSYEEAILNRQVQALQQQQLLQQLQKLPLQPSQPQHEVPGVHKLSPSGGSLRQTATQRSIYENVTPGDVPSQPQSLIIPQSPSQRNTQARHEFFTQTPSNVVSKTIMAASSDGQSIQSLGSTDSNATVRVEDEMRKSTSDPIGKSINERYNFNDMDRNLSALVKPLWAGTEKEDRAEKDDSTSS
ncbi:CBN-MEC-2 protein [Caenorhabditis brenneri]|uniref:CBN-MEC-2 protein n=1 Tax=Caenorhabditis brenneri TaxID=135651 RepID=G0M6H0_CAEBE|nr:CBN-MEC-2 protein [Caenorhabditis brenneri]